MKESPKLLQNIKIIISTQQAAAVSSVSNSSEIK